MTFVQASSEWQIVYKTLPMRLTITALRYTLVLRCVNVGYCKILTSIIRLLYDDYVIPNILCSRGARIYEFMGGGHID